MFFFYIKVHNCTKYTWNVAENHAKMTCHILVPNSGCQYCQPCALSTAPRKLVDDISNFDVYIPSMCFLHLKYKDILYCFRVFTNEINKKDRKFFDFYLWNTYRTLWSEWAASDVTWPGYYIIVDLVLIKSLGGLTLAR